MTREICPCCKRPMIYSQAKSEEFKVKFGETFIQENRRKFGTFKGHNKWDLAVTWFQTDNDTFYKIYGFNFVPKGFLFELAQTYVFYSKSSEPLLQSSMPNSIEPSREINYPSIRSEIDPERIMKSISEQFSRSIRNSIGRK